MAMKKAIFVFLLFGWVFNAQAQFDSGNGDYGKSLISFTPGKLYADFDPYVMVGASYERFFNDYVSYKVPLHFALNFNYVQSGVELKMYPTAHQGVFKYSIGPYLFAGRYDDSEIITAFDSNTGSSFERLEETKCFQIGLSLQQALNLTISEQFYIGLEQGFGLTNLNRSRVNDGPVRNLGTQFNLNMGLHLGFRF